MESFIFLVFSVLALSATIALGQPSVPGATNCTSGTIDNNSTCVDINECAKDLHNCDPEFLCVNTEGSYECKCLFGKEFAATGCTGNADLGPSCAPGFVFDSNLQDCVDIDECSQVPSPCSDFSTCTNVVGGYTCACHVGYTMVNDLCVSLEELKLLRMKAPPQNSTLHADSEKPEKATLRNSGPNKVTASTGGLGTNATDALPPILANATDEALCTGLIDSQGLHVRREWNELSAVQKAVFIEGARMIWRKGAWLKALWFHQQTEYDELIHASNHFLHWHRYLILLWELQVRALGDKFKCFSLPYWDFTMDVKENPFEVPNITVVNELGGPSTECIDFFGPVTYGQNECITRTFNHSRGWRPPGPIEVAEGILATDKFYPFSDLLKGWHALIHNRSGGTLQNGVYAAHDPLFLLLHCMVDKIFATWQACHGADDAPPGEVSPVVYEPSIFVLKPNTFDTNFAVYSLRDIFVTPRQTNNVAYLGYTYSPGPMNQSSNWVALGNCSHSVPWYPSTGQADANSTSSALPGGPQKRDVSAMGRTGESQYAATTANVERHMALARRDLPEADMAAILREALRHECMRYPSSGPIDEDWAKRLGIEGYELPCQVMGCGARGRFF